MGNFWTDWAGRAVGPLVVERQDEAVLAPAGGLVAGSRVATERGWVGVEDLALGERVMTFDNGLQEIVCLCRRIYPGAPATGVAPLVLAPAGAIGNRRALALLPEQPILVESDLAESLTGDPFATIRARDLTAVPGVMAMLPEEGVAVTAIGFEAQEAVFVEGQALALCAAGRELAPATLEEAIWGPEPARYPVLDGREAELVAASVVRLN